jgi:L-lactate dehydrogenase complex protein LldG
MSQSDDARCNGGKMSFDTSKARDAIMQRIRTAQKRGAAVSDQADVDEYLARHPAGPQPTPYADRPAQFRLMAERMASTVENVPTLAEAPAAIARYLAGQGIAPNVVVWPALRDLPWVGAGLQAEFRPPRRDESQGADLVGVTGAFCAIAETGTLVLLSGADTPASTHLLPETHIALLRADRIVDTMEDAFELLRREHGGVERMMPRAINMVSGPSRTGDIEQTIVLGAHGPYRVHIIIAASA